MIVYMSYNYVYINCTVRCRHRARKSIYQSAHL